MTSGPNPLVAEVRQLYGSAIAAQFARRRFTQSTGISIGMEILDIITRDTFTSDHEWQNLQPLI